MLFTYTFYYGNKIILKNIITIFNQEKLVFKSVSKSRQVQKGVLKFY